MNWIDENLASSCAVAASLRLAFLSMLGVHVGAIEEADEHCLYTAHVAVRKFMCKQGQRDTWTLIEVDPHTRVHGKVWSTDPDVEYGAGELVDVVLQYTTGVDYQIPFLYLEIDKGDIYRRYYDSDVGVIAAHSRKTGADTEWVIGAYGGDVYLQVFWESASSSLDLRNATRLARVPF